MAVPRKPQPRPMRARATNVNEPERPHQRELGRDGITVMVNKDRAVRAREIARPLSAIPPTQQATLEDRINGRSWRSRQQH